MNQVSAAKKTSKLPRTLLLLALVLSVAVIGAAASPVYAERHDNGNGNSKGNGNGRGNANGMSHSNNTNTNTNTGSAIDATMSLANLVDGMNLANGTSRSLNAKLEAAINALSNGRTTAAKNILKAFINEVNAKCCNANGKPLTTQEANRLTAAAEQISQSI